LFVSTLKSNAIALVKNKQLVGKGCGQTSRIDALRHAVEKAKQFEFNLTGAVMASDAFFPFNDCVKMGHDVGITAFIQPGGSIRDKDSIAYCQENNLRLVMTGYAALQALRASPTPLQIRLAFRFPSPLEKVAEGRMRPGFSQHTAPALRR
jgi:AICAR transformylase/IMP cyclohydrolase PurH